MFESLDEIGEKYNINFENFEKYQKEILSIFNSEQLNIDDYDLNDSNILNIIGLYYNNVIKDNQLTEIFYLLATQKNNHYAIKNLAYFYEKINKNELMLKYLLMAFQNNSDDLKLINNIAICYKNQKDYDLMINYYLPFFPF